MTRLLLSLVLTTPLAAQYRADSIRISRLAHDAAYVAAGTAVSLTLRELGVPSSVALSVPPAFVVIKSLARCLAWCGRPDIDWPARVAIRDGFYELVLVSGPALALELGRGHRWRGLLVAVGWGLVVWRMDHGRWGSP